METEAIDHSLWTKKAAAFVTRSHRHLWGKNNEEPQAFLFTCGLKNSFIKAQLMGWNKFGQMRPAANWGIPPDPAQKGKLFLGPGIVIPHIMDKELKSVFIVSYNETEPGSAFMIPGSTDPTFVMEKGSGSACARKIALTTRLLDGLFLFQELPDTFCIIIHPDPDIPMAGHIHKRISQAAGCLVFPRRDFEGHQIRKIYNGPTGGEFRAFRSKEEMLENCLKS